MKKSKFKKLIFLSIIILFINCSKSNKKDLHSNSFLEVYYLRAGMRFPMSLNCESLNSPMFSKEVKYKKITNDSVLNSFAEEFTLLEKENFQRSVDTRIKVIYHHGKNIDTICMGDLFFISVNGELKKDSPNLLKLIRQNITPSAKSGQ